MRTTTIIESSQRETDDAEAEPRVTTRKIIHLHASERAIVREALQLLLADYVRREQPEQMVGLLQGLFARAKKISVEVKGDDR